MEPLGFSLDEREVKRAGLDYWEHVDLRVWKDWDSLVDALPGLGTPFFFSSEGAADYWDAPFADAEGVVLVFGRETDGLPREIRDRYRDRLYRMPMSSDVVRSLNLSTSVALGVYEVIRQRR